MQQPYPPILVGGSGRGLLRIAARHADIANIILEAGSVGRLKLANFAKVTDDLYKEKIRFLRDEARRQGRDPKAIRISSAIFSVTLTESRAATEASARDMASTFGSSVEEILRSPLSLIGTH